MKTSQKNQWPDNEYIHTQLHSLLKDRINDKNHLVNSLSLYIRRMHWGKIFALYEAFKITMGLPGDIVELGVFKGESLLILAKLVEIFQSNDRSVEVIGFDTFAGFPALSSQDDGDDSDVDRTAGGWNSSAYYHELKQLIDIFDHDRLAPQKPRIRLIEGDITDTVPSFVKDNPGLKIKLLNIDCDLYKPTLIGLKCLYDKIVKGGIILLDEYAFKEFPGESAAVDEFFSGQPPQIKRFEFSANPGGYIIK